MDTKTARVRVLNDELRQHLTGGTAVITLGVASPSCWPRSIESTLTICARAARFYP
jgi:hypothetical protein